MDDNRGNKLVFGILILAIAALFIEYGFKTTPATKIAIHILDFAVLILFVIEYLIRLVSSKFKINFIRRNLFDTAFIIIFTCLFVYSKYMAFLMTFGRLETISSKLILIRSAFAVLKIFGRFKKFNYFLRKFAKNPAQTMVLSFLVLIFIGTMLLMMSFATADARHLGFVNAFFTSTSAVCVTGLIVVDTATAFSLYGKIVIMLLIQSGGLGIMLFTYLTAFLLKRKISLEEKIEISYMLNENDMQNLSRTVVRIVTLTFAIELAGALLLFLKFGDSFGLGLKACFYSAFHAISAFCNAGFALYTNNFEGFRSDALFNFCIAALIILGGISFAVITDSFQYIKDWTRRKITGRRASRGKLSLNSTVVLVITVILIVSGALIIYGLEHNGNLIRYDLKTQYLSAFFQSVTLRTAGFNTIDMSHLRLPTYLVMIAFMFIGGAAGSTAGGVKVNTVAVIYAYLKSIFRGNYSVTLRGYFLHKYVVSRALLIVVLGGTVIFMGTLLLTVSEHFRFIMVLFEVVSAFGTVGLSTGITSALSVFGKLVIIATMFFGRLGPLTIMAAISMRKKQIVKYPEGFISMS